MHYEIEIIINFLWHKGYNVFIWAAQQSLLIPCNIPNDFDNNYSLARPTMATRISFVQVFDRFLSSLMAVDFRDHFLYTNAQSTEDNIFCYSWAFLSCNPSNLSKTCQKLV